MTKLMYSNTSIIRANSVIDYPCE